MNKRGFTLVEMLVATALVVLMMLMFAQVFQTAGGLVSNQKGMAELDQNVRTLTILLRGDMKQRTFVDVVPFVSGQDTTGNFGENYNASRRRGFFSISENDPNNATDDVLHLTIATEEGPTLPYSGRAKLMFNGTAPANPDAYLLANPDQPEFDDGQLSVNNTGSSRYAEVCWFLRNGILYRRQFLIRNPYNRNGNSTEEPQDSAATPAEFIETTYAAEGHVNATTNPNGVFWRDFDYAAYADAAGNTKFHTPGSLDNISNSPANPNLANLPTSLGIPFLRFGSSISRAQSGPPVVIFPPREFLDPADQATYIGRFTTEETTHADFTYPGNSTLATDPHNSASGPSLTLANGVVTEYQFADQDQRRGEDIVMSNVHSFDVQVWDDILKEFVDIGHSKTGTVLDVNGQPVPNVPGWYNASRRRNTDFGNSYDTWHPFSDMPNTPYAPFGDPSTGDKSDERPDRSAAQNLGLGDAGEIPLRAVQIKVRFYDPGSESMRDLTFTFPLVEN